MSGSTRYKVVAEGSAALIALCTLETINTRLTEGGISLTHDGHDVKIVSQRVVCFWVDIPPSASVSLPVVLYSSWVFSLARGCVGRHCTNSVSHNFALLVVSSSVSSRF